MLQGLQKVYSKCSIPARNCLRVASHQAPMAFEASPGTLFVFISLSGQCNWPTVRGSPREQWCHSVGSCQATVLCALEAGPDTWPGLVSDHLVGPQFCPKSPLLVSAQPPRGDSPTPPPLEPGTEIVTPLTLGSGRGNISGLHSVPKNTQCVLISLPLPHSL